MGKYAPGLHSVSLDYKSHSDPSRFEALRSSLTLRMNWDMFAMHFATAEVQFDKDMENEFPLLGVPLEGMRSGSEVS